MKDIGRNDPCHCGAKKPGGKPVKYKKCHWLKESQPVSDEVMRELIKVLAKNQEHEQSMRERGIFMNYVNPATYTNPKTGQGVKAWALGSRLFHTRPEHETFHEFVVSHLQREVLGKEWWEKEARASQKHFIFECFTKWEEWRRKNAIEGEKINEHVYSGYPDGWAQTLVSLAFDIATLEHAKKLPDHLVNRLKNRGEYQGAHYEIAVAAIFARLGCNIDFLDDKKTEEKHCEFIATHAETGVRIAVEAKSRQRPGVKHREGSAEPEQLLKGDVGRLFRDALAKNPQDITFIIFIDVNAPLTPQTPMQEKPWYKDVKVLMAQYPESSEMTPEKYTAAFFTNFSPHYNAERTTDPNEYFVVLPQFAMNPMPNPVFSEMLLAAINNYGFVPDLKEV
jgi:hypothetical protein